MTAQKTALVTGTSQGGLGDYLAQDLHRRGFRVFATARSPSKVEHLKEMGLGVVLMEVTDSTSIKKAVEEVRALTEGKLDLLVNNSGVGYKASLLDTDLAEAKALFDVNIWGLLEVTQAFIPMLMASKGTIVNIGSVAGRVPLPFQGVYNMSKAALEHLSRQMRVEYSAFDVKVVHVQMGGIKTGFFDHAGESHFPETSLYYPGRGQLEPWTNSEAQKTTQRTPPEECAKSIIDNALKSSPSSCQWTAYGGWQTWLVSKFLWYNATDIMLKAMGFPNLKRAILGNDKDR